MMRSAATYTLCLFILILFSWPTPAKEMPVSSSILKFLNDEEKEEVLSGKIIVQEVPNPGKIGSTYQAIGLIPGGLDQTSAVLLAFEKYPEFMPNVEALEAKQYPDKSIVTDYTLGLPLGKKKKYRLKFELEKTPRTFRLSWKLIPRPDLEPNLTIVNTTGYWLLETFPQKEGHILALYHVYTDPGHIPWGFGWIVDILTSHSIPDIIQATRDRIKTASPQSAK